MIYIDMNMVRAGVVKHPEAWPSGGYRYTLAPPVELKKGTLSQKTGEYFTLINTKSAC